MHDLATILAKLFPDEEDVKPIVSRSDLDFSRLKSASKPYNRWFNVTEEAQKHGKTGQLIDVALEEFPKNVDLLREKIIFLERSDPQSQVTAIASVERNRSVVAEVAGQSRASNQSIDNDSAFREDATTIDQIADQQIDDKADQQQDSRSASQESKEKPAVAVNADGSNRKLGLVGIAGAPLLAVALAGYFRCTLGLQVFCKAAQLPSFVPEMVEIVGGRFLMGSESGDDNEKPVQRVRVKSFELSRTEVTVAQYAECVAENVCPVPEPATTDLCTWPGLQKALEEKLLPINCVSWNDAVAYVNFISSWLPNARLPTEAEWEYAARDGGKRQEYPWGNEVPDKCEKAVTSACEEDGVMPVCSKESGNTSAGICDMAGNLWEWIEDDYHGSYEGAPDDGSAWADTPRGSDRVFRGGSFWDAPRDARLAVRYRFESGNRNAFVGFRIARSLPSSL